jgi:diphthamide synthase subunit DPH2
LSRHSGALMQKRQSLSPRQSVISELSRRSHWKIVMRSRNGQRRAHIAKLKSSAFGNVLQNIYH